MADEPRIVVVGAGFAGLWCVKRLGNAPCRVILLDRQNYHTFLPLLYQVAAAEIGPAEIAYPVRSILRGVPNVEFRMAEVRGVDLAAREVETRFHRIRYDHLVLAMGAAPHYFGAEGAREHAFPLRTLEDAIPLRHHVLAQFEAAAFEADPTRRRQRLTFVVVGGGPTGVEYSGALAELVHGPLRHDYPEIPQDEVRILLVEAAGRLLQGLPEPLAAYARRRLEERGVEVRTDAPVTAVERYAVVLDGGGRIATDTVVWSGGVRGVAGPEAWGLPTEPGGRVRVRPTLEADGSRGVWVAGDLAYLEDEHGAPLPGVAPVAIQQGERVARNLLRILEGRAPEPFRYRDPGMLAVIGRSAAVAHLRGRSFRGFPAWVLWLAVHIARLIGFRNRALVLVNWAWNYLFFRRAVRLVLPWRESDLADPPEPREPAGSGGRGRG